MNKGQSLQLIGLLTTLGLFVVGGLYLFAITRKADPLFMRATIRAILVTGALIGVQVAGFVLSR